MMIMEKKITCVDFHRATAILKIFHLATAILKIEYGS